MTLSLDLASRQSGWAIFDGEKLIKYGIIKPRPTTLSADERLPIIEKEIEKLFADYSIDFAIIENPAGGKEDDRGPDKNWITLFTLAEAHGVVRNIFIKHRIKFEVISPSTWQNRLEFFKRDRAGRKAAAKKYVQEHYGLGEEEQDIYDAICLFDCHIYLKNFKEKEEVSAF